MAHAPNIRIETHTLAPEDRHALTACADIVLSLHRGEGFGLVMAEAMLLGKPVVATGWSGNTDYHGRVERGAGRIPTGACARRPVGLPRRFGLSLMWRKRRSGSVAWPMMRGSPGDGRARPEAAR